MQPGPCKVCGDPGAKGHNMDCEMLCKRCSWWWGDFLKSHEDTWNRLFCMPKEVAHGRTDKQEQEEAAQA
jgi:hypothetical protein